MSRYFLTLLFWADVACLVLNAVLGNPPWDIVKLNLREFFSAYDSGFRELERVAAEHRQAELLHHDAELVAALRGDGHYKSSHT
jgi:hypothetical protein